MAAPTYKDKGLAGLATSGTSTFFYYPTVAANDLLFLCVADFSMTQLNVDSTWTLKAKKTINEKQNSIGGPQFNIYMYSKLATGSESGTETITRIGDTGLLCVLPYSFDGDNYIIIEDITTNSSITDDVSWNDVAVGGSERSLIAFLVNYNKTASITISSISGYTMNANTQFIGGGSFGYCSFQFNSKINVSSASAETSTNGSIDGWGTIHLSVYNATPSVTANRSFIVN